MSDVEKVIEELSPMPELQISEVIYDLHKMNEMYQRAEIQPLRGSIVGVEIDNAIAALIRADRAFHILLAQEEQRKEQ